MAGAGEVFGRAAEFHQHRRLVDHLAGPVAKDVHTEHAVGCLVGQHLDETVRMQRRARTPQRVWSTTLETVADERCGPPRAATTRRPCRVRRVRWLNPLERIAMLTRAGCSEERIYRMMMESSDIAMSRRLCVSMQRQVAA